MDRKGKHGLVQCSDRAAEGGVAPVARPESDTSATRVTGQERPAHPVTMAGRPAVGRTSYRGPSRAPSCPTPRTSPRSSTHCRAPIIWSRAVRAIGVGYRGHISALSPREGTGEPVITTPRPPKAMVALLNSSEDVIARLREALDEGGFRTVAAHVADVQMGVLDIIAWMSETGADVILIDLPRPDARALNFLRLLQHVDMLHQCGWVLTTTHKDAIWTTSGESGQPHPSAGEVRKLT
jgi:hypothetical protein